MGLYLSIINDYMPTPNWCWNKGCKTPSVGTTQPFTSLHEHVCVFMRACAHNEELVESVLPQRSFLWHMSLLKSWEGGRCEVYVSYIQSGCIYSTMGIHTHTHIQRRTHTHTHTQKDSMKKIHLGKQLSQTTKLNAANHNRWPDSSLRFTALIGKLKVL